MRLVQGLIVDHEGHLIRLGVVQFSRLVLIGLPGGEGNAGLQVLHQPRDYYAFTLADLYKYIVYFLLPKDAKQV